jgi:hypothetical protein
MSGKTFKQIAISLFVATITVAIIQYVRWVLDGAPGVRDARRRQCEANEP